MEDYIKKHGYSNIKVNDCHFHYNRPYLIQDNVKHFKEVCDYFNLDKVTLLALTDTFGCEHNMASNAEGLYFKDVLYPSVYTMAYFIHSGEEWEDIDGCKNQAIRFMDMGFDGIKMLEGKPDRHTTPLTAECFKRFYEYAEKEGVHILMHAGDPGAPETDGIIREIEELLSLYPKLKLTLAHMANIYNEPKRLAKILDNYENVNIDLAVGGSFVVAFSRDLDFWREFMIHYQDRILYGTDTYTHELHEETIDSDIAIRHKILRDFFEKNGEKFESPLLYTTKDENGNRVPLKMNSMTNLPGDIVDKIYRKNFIRLFGEKPRKINYKKASEYTQKMLAGYLSGLYHSEENIDAPEWYSENEARNLKHYNSIAIENLKFINEHFKSKM